MLVVLTERNVFSALLRTRWIIILGKAREALEKVNLWGKRNELAIKSFLRAKKIAGNRPRHFHSKRRCIYLTEPFARIISRNNKTVSGIIKNLRQKARL